MYARTHTCVTKAEEVPGFPFVGSTEAKDGKPFFFEQLIHHWFLKKNSAGNPSVPSPPGMRMYVRAHVHAFAHVHACTRLCVVHVHARVYMLDALGDMIMVGLGDTIMWRWGI